MSDESVNDNEWHNIRVVSDASELSIFVDNQEKHSMISQICEYDKLSGLVRKMLTVSL